MPSLRERLILEFFTVGGTLSETIPAELVVVVQAVRWRCGKKNACSNSEKPLIIIVTSGKDELIYSEVIQPLRAGFIRVEAPF